MTHSFTTCEGMNCPSKKNCKRYTERKREDALPAAIWIRREAGSSACDMYLPIVVISTFKEEA